MSVFSEVQKVAQYSLGQVVKAENDVEIQKGVFHIGFLQTPVSIVIPSHGVYSVFHWACYRLL